MRTTLKRLMAPEIKRTIQEFRYYRQDLFEKFPKKIPENAKTNKVFEGFLVVFLGFVYAKN